MLSYWWIWHNRKPCGARRFANYAIEVIRVDFNSIALGLPSDCKRCEALREGESVLHPRHQGWMATAYLDASLTQRFGEVSASEHLGLRDLTRNLSVWCLVTGVWSLEG